MAKKLQPANIVALFDTNKEERQAFAGNIIEAVKAGNVNALDLHLQVKKMEDVIKQITGSPEYTGLLLEEAGKHGSKEFDYQQAKVSIREVGTKYDYSVCEDVEYQKLEAQKAELDVKIKARQKFLQGVPDGGVADPQHGNMVYRASKSSTTSVVVTLK